MEGRRVSKSDWPARLALVLAAVALVPAFGQWLFPIERVDSSKANSELNSAASSSPPIAEPLVAEKPRRYNPEENSTAATIKMHREAVYLFKWVEFSYLLDGGKLAVLGNGQKGVAKVPAGRYEFHIESKIPFGTVQSNSLVLNLNQGDVVVIVCRGVAGWLRDRVECRIASGDNF
jgi:hypothetical protein